jgi:hypothetical protein
MTTLDVLIRERVEEIRSRLAVLECTLMDMKQDFYTIFDSFYSRNVCPPFLFPVSTFLRLESHINRFRHEIENINPEDAAIRIALKLNKWNSSSRSLLCEINRLQNVLSQRIAGIGKSKFLEHQLIGEVEYGTLSKAYIAVDVLTLELVKRTLGKYWIQQEKYVPISLFDDRGYMINLYSYVISIPYYDNFRSRFWPILAHEIAHMLVSFQARRRGPLRDIMLRGQNQLIESLGLEPYIAALQITELTSDIISAYVCPTLFLSGLECNSMIICLETRQGGLINDFQVYSSHLPSDSRLAAMEKVLELQNILGNDQNLREISGSMRIFFSMKNLAISSSSYDFIERYNEFARSYSENVLHCLSRIGVQGFDSDDWESAYQSFLNPKTAPQSSVHILALVWMKRLNKTKTNGNLLIADFFRERRDETKTFEYAVEQMYKYYETEIVPKVRAFPYDLRFNFG